jgi:hypothetical protein
MSVVRESLPLRARLQQHRRPLLLLPPKSRLLSNPVRLHRLRLASPAREPLLVLLLGVLLPRVVFQLLLQLSQNLLSPCVRLLPLPLIPKKRSSVLVKRLSSSRRRTVLRVCVALRNKKKRKNHRGYVKRLLVCRENRKRQRERQSKNVLSV